MFPRSGNTRFQEGVRFYGTIRIVISTDGAKLLKAHREELESKSIAREDITLYLEDNTGDVLSDGVMLVNAGDIAQQRLYDGTGVYDFVNSKHSLNKQQFKELLSYTNDSDLLVSFVALAVSRLYDLISFVPDKVAKLLDSATGFISNKARIDESVWNPKKRKHAQDYGDLLSAIESRLKLVNEKVSKLTAKENTIVPVAIKAPLRTLQDILRSFQSFSRSLADSIQGASELLIAFVCGVWNALIDLVNGLLTLCSLLLKVPGAIGDMAGGSDEFPYFYQLFKEYMDNFIQSVAAIDWAEVFSEIGQGFIDLMVAIPEKLQELSAAEVGYYSGYIAFNIAEFFFPVLKIAKLAKAGKFGEGFAEMVTDMQKVAQNMANAGRKVGRAVSQAPKKAYDFLLDMLDNLTTLLRQGTATVKELVQKMFEKIRAWLDDLIYGLKNTKLYKTFSATWDLLNELGARIVRNIDDNLSGGLAVATPDGFVVRYGGKPIFEGTEEALERFLNKMEGIRNSAGKQAVKEELELLAKSARAKYADFLKSKGWRLLSKKTQLELVDDAGRILFRGSNELLDKYITFARLPLKKQKVFLEKAFKIAQSNKGKVYNVVESNRRLKSIGVNYFINIFKKGARVTPDFSIMGNDMFMNAGKLGNGKYDLITKLKGYTQKDITDALQKLKRYKGTIKTHVTSNRFADFTNCWNELGIHPSLGRKILAELDLTWHHLDDLDSTLKGSFQLVHRKIHKQTTQHMGSHFLLEKIFSLLK